MTAVAAQQTVQVFWPYTLGSNQAQLVRVVIDNANTIQDKYKFIYVMKPGAGGTIATASTLTSQGLNILAHSSSFYTVPYTIKGTYNVDDFRVVTELCKDRPLAIYSKKLTRLDGHNRELSAGITPGGVLSLVPKLINQNSDIKMLEIPYKGAADSTIDLLSGTIDTTVDWLSSYRTQSDLNILGITGRRPLAGAKTFQSQKIKGLETLVTDVFIFAPANMDDTTVKELNTIFNNSNSGKAVSICNDDYGTTTKTPYEKTSSVHNENKNRWRQLMSNIQ